MNNLMPIFFLSLPFILIFVVSACVLGMRITLTAFGLSAVLIGVIIACVFAAEYFANN